VSLTRSKRISLMTEASSRLEAEPWAIIDLTLKQFDLPIKAQWDGSASSYILEMISTISDGVLVELAEHLGLAVDSKAATSLDPAFWQKGMLRLFISHLATHKAWAAQLKESLLDFGISAFVAHNDIKPTLEWQNQIETALATCDALVALLHEKFHESQWTDQEIGFVMGRGMPAFAVRLGETPYGFIGRFQAFNGKHLEPPELAEELFNAYRTNKQTKDKMAEVIIRLFENSSSFAEAKTRIVYVEQLDIWRPSFSVRIDAAVTNNGQVEGSWGVPERVKKLVVKWKPK
jgi:hypothetical protein